MTEAKQPEALRLALEISAGGRFANEETIVSAAIELRRLHAENEALRAQAAPAAVAGPSESVKFMDQSTAGPVEKARRYLTAMGDQRTNSAYFYDDGYPRRESAQDALATLAVLEQLAAAPTTQPAPVSFCEQWPIDPEVSADLERSDWPPEEALHWYAAGKHYDTVPNGDGSSSARILDNGAVASNALKSMSREYAAHKGDVALLETAPQQEVQEPVDSMGMPLSCGKPLCSPGNHHPLCKLSAPQPQPTAQSDALPQIDRTVLAMLDAQHIDSRYAPLLAVAEQLQESSDYWSEYDVPVGIVEALKAAIDAAKGKA